MRTYGPVFLHLYGVDEETIIDSWTVDKFLRYADAADQFLEMRAG